MISNETNSSIWPCLLSFHYIPWNFPCLLCRLGGIIMLVISIVCCTFNIRFLFFHRCQNNLVVSLFIASLLVLTVSVPGVLVQLFTCHRHCFKFYCRIEGFTSYLSGCLCMLIFMALSIHRYLSLRGYDQLLSTQFSTFICWFLSLAFTFPLVFDYLNSYLPEGLGFHCSINWQGESTLSRLYIFFSFILMYFLPLIILLYVNIRSHHIVRDIHSKRFSNSSFLLYYDYPKSSKKQDQRINYYEDIYDPRYYIRKATDRKHFRIVYRFLRAIIFLISSYLIAWTPYSIIAILQLLNIKFIFRHAFLITLSAIIAKISVILTPVVYISIMNHKLFKRTLFK